MCLHVADCYLHLERDGIPCDDGNPDTKEDQVRRSLDSVGSVSFRQRSRAVSQCYRGVCGGWASYETVIQTEEDRKLWLEADPTLDNCDRSLSFTGCPTQGCGAGCWGNRSGGW